MTKRKNPTLDILGGTKHPTPYNRYQARNGLYYNGYMQSNDLVEDMQPMYDEALAKLEKKLKKEGLL